MTTVEAVRKRVAIVGSGAAGTAAAWALSRDPVTKFEVDVYERTAKPGGVAESRDIGGGLWVNNGVQGGAPSYANTFHLLNDAGVSKSKVHMKFSFGNGENTWNNSAHFSELQRELRKEIESFADTVKTIKRFEFIFGFTPIAKALKMFGYSDRFAQYMIYPILALFFGTGNQTASVPAAVVARIFLDENGLRFFNYDPRHMVVEQPEMFAFPNFNEFFEKLVQRCSEHSGGRTQFHFDTPVSKVIRNDDNTVTIHYSKNIVSQDKNKPISNINQSVIKVEQHQGQTESKPTEETTTSSSTSSTSAATTSPLLTKTYDYIILACDAETCLKIVDSPTFWENQMLSNVKYYNDITITHEDSVYMSKYYDNKPERGDQYYIHQYPEDASLCDMSFNLSNYQPQLSKSDRIIYQTIFLNDELRDRHWTINQISKDKILLETWWRQFCHRWEHFAMVLPVVNRAQGTKGTTFYAGSWTMVNTFEVAVISGLAAARRCGAEYPFMADEMAKMQFNAYMIGMHGEIRWQEKQREEWNEEVKRLRSGEEGERYKELRELRGEEVERADDEEKDKKRFELVRQRGGWWEWLFGDHHSK